MVHDHHEANPTDPLPIPFTDPEPQVTIPYSNDHPYHVQIHRDAFSYGDVGPKADPRLIVDIRFFGKQDIKEYNRVYFGPPDEKSIPAGWTPGITDSYGMPQATVSALMVCYYSPTEVRKVRMAQVGRGQCS
jgi:pyranose oxidase